MVLTAVPSVSSYSLEHFNNGKHDKQRAKLSDLEAGEEDSGHIFTYVVLKQYSCQMSHYLYRRLLEFLNLHQTLGLPCQIW